MSIIIVKPIERQRWYKNDKANFIIRPTKFQCAVDKLSRKYILDCTDEERKELENITGFDLSLNFKTTEQHSFFDDEISHITLKHGINIFNTEDPLDRLKIYMLKGHPMVANSLEEYEKTKNPNYKFVIYNEVEEDRLKSSKKAVVRSAILEMAKLDTEKKISIYRILTGKNIKDQPIDVIDMKLEEYLVRNVDNFLNVLKSKPQDISLHSFILELIDARILTKEGDMIKYGDVLIGADIANAIKFFKDVKNQELKLQLQQKL